MVGAFGVGLFQPCEHAILFAQPRVDPRSSISRALAAAGLRLEVTLLGRLYCISAQQRVAIGNAGVGQSIINVFGNRLLEILDAALESIFGPLVQVERGLTQTFSHFQNVL